MSFARPPRNFTLALFLFDSRKGPSTRSLPLPFSLIQTPKPENPNPRLKAAKEPPKVKIISFFFFFFFLFTSFTFSGRNVIIVGRIAGVYKQNRRQKLAKMKNRNCCYINLHGARRYSKLSPPLFFSSLFLLLLFSFPLLPLPLFFLCQTESRKRVERLGAKLATLLFTSSRNSARQKCVFLTTRVCRVAVVYVRGLHKSPSWTVYTGKKGNGSGLGTCNFDKATCMSNWPRFIKLSLLSLLFPLPA